GGRGERPRRPRARQPARVQHDRRDRPVPDRGVKGAAMPDRILSPRVAVYTGTFDPVHYGHLDIIERGSRLFERLIVGVGVNPDKQTMFTIDERVAHIQAETENA